LAPIDVQELIDAGVHFGHRTSRWNPKMAPFILKKRNLIHIIDLRHTVRGMITAERLAAAVAARAEYVLLVGTKRQARGTIRAEAERCGMPYVSERWPGGLLTNYSTIRKRLDRLVELEDLEKTGQINLYSKKRVSSLRRERRKIERNLGGVRKMDKVPGLLVIVDPKREHLAVKEAVKLGIPTIAWMDTDSDPGGIDVVVPANDDAIGAIQVFMRLVGDAIRAETGMEEPEQVAPPEDAGAAESEVEAAEPAEEQPTAGEEQSEAPQEEAAPESIPQDDTAPQ